MSCKAAADERNDNIKSIMPFVEPRSKRIVSLPKPADCHNKTVDNKPTAAMTNDDVRKRCIFKNRILQQRSTKDGQSDCRTGNSAVAKTQCRPGSPLDAKPRHEILPLDSCNSAGEVMLMQRHRTIILEALVRLRVAAQRNICRLSRNDMPIGEKRYLKARFMCTLREVDQYMARIMDMQGMAYSSLFVNLFQLEMEYNKHLQRFVDVLDKSKNDRKGIVYNCLNLLSCFSCRCF